MSGSAPFNPSYEVAPMRQPMNKSKGKWFNSNEICAILDSFGHSSDGYANYLFDSISFFFQAILEVISDIGLEIQLIFTC